MFFFRFAKNEMIMPQRITNRAREIINWFAQDKVHCLPCTAETDVETLSFDLPILLDINVIQIPYEYTPQSVRLRRRNPRIVDDVALFTLAGVERHYFKFQLFKIVIPLWKLGDPFHQQFLLVGVRRNNTNRISPVCVTEVP